MSVRGKCILSQQIDPPRRNGVMLLPNVWFVMLSDGVLAAFELGGEGMCERSLCERIQKFGCGQVECMTGVSFGESSESSFWICLSRLSRIPDYIAAVTCQQSLSCQWRLVRDALSVCGFRKFRTTSAARISGPQEDVVPRKFGPDVFRSVFATALCS